MSEQKPTDRTRLWIWGMICATVLLIAVFVWPTPYEYRTSPHGNILKVNRFTGHVQMMTRY